MTIMVRKVLDFMEDTKELDAEVPLLPKGLRVGITYNLKTGEKKEAIDSEAEYDNIETVYAIRDALTKAGAKVILLQADQTLPAQLKKTKVDIVFNIAEGIYGRGREAQVPALLNMYGIPYTGSDETTLCLALDKALTKRLLATYRIETPRYTVLSENKNRMAKLKFPVIIKPNAEGSSKGISDVSIVENPKELKELVNKNIELYHQDMLAEEYIEGREFTVGLLGNGNDVHVFSPMEIVYKKETQGNYHVYSYNVKQDYTRFVQYECPSKISQEIEAKMMADSKKIFQALSCKDFARIDFRVTKEGKVSFIEINPLPGLAPNYSDYPMLAEFCGVSYDTLVVNILKEALKRHHIVTKESKVS